MRMLPWTTSCRATPGSRATPAKHRHNMLDEKSRARGFSTPNYVPAALCIGQHEMGAMRTFEGIQELSHALGISSEGNRRRIHPNPAAGDVRSREYRYGPWLQLANRRLEAENTKAEGVIFEKRVFDLAKQAVAGLQGVGVRCEMTTIANVLRTACKHRALRKEHQRAIPEKVKKETEHACRVLDACLRFDSRRLAALLCFTIKREKTFGKGVPI